MRARFFTFCTLLIVGLSVDAQRLIVTDSGGVEREVSRLIVTDSGGTEREIERLFVVDSGGTARLVFRNALVTVSNESVVADPGEVAGIRYNSDGTVDNNIDGVYSQVNNATDWIIPNDAASGDYEIRATLDSGTTPDGTLDTWLALSTSREWTLTSTGNCSLTIEIRKGGVVQDSGTITLQSL